VPAEKVELRRATGLQLAGLFRQTGNLEAARAELEAVLADQPANVAALLELSEVHMAQGHWWAASEALDRLSGLQTDTDQRVDILFRQGEVLLRGVKDREAAAEAYLKAIDLDPNHVPTLRRLVDHYFRAGEFEGAMEMGAALDAQGALFAEGTAPASLARVAMAAAIEGNTGLALKAMNALGAESVKPLAIAAAEATLLPELPERLPDALRWLCVTPGPPLASVKQLLAEKSHQRPRLQELVARL